MKTEGGREHFSLGFNLDRLNEGQAEAVRLFEELAERAKSEADRIQESFENISFKDLATEDITYSLSEMKTELEQLDDIITELRGKSLDFYVESPYEVRDELSETGQMYEQMESKVRELSYTTIELSNSTSDLISTNRDLTEALKVGGLNAFAESLFTALEMSESFLDVISSLGRSIKKMSDFKKVAKDVDEAKESFKSFEDVETIDTLDQLTLAFDTLAENARVRAQSVKDALEGINEADINAEVISTLEGELERLIETHRELEEAKTLVLEAMTEEQSNSEEAIQMFSAMDEAMRELNDSYVSLSNTLRRFETSQSDATTTTREATQAKEESTEATAATKESEEELWEEIRRMNEERERQEASTRGSTKATEDSTKSTEDNTKATKDNADAKGESSKKTEEATTSWGRFKENITSVNEKLNDSTKSSGKISGAFNKLTGSLAPLDAAAGKLPQSFGMATKAVKGLGVASYGLMAIPIIAAIVAVAVAVEGLNQWFTKTRAGEEALADASAALGGTMHALNKRLKSAGETIATGLGFDSASDAMTKLGKIANTVLGQMINRVTGAAKTIAGAFGLMKDIVTLNFKNIGKSWDLLIDGVVQQATGKDDSGDSTFSEDAEEYTKALKEINRAELALEDERIDWLEKRAKLELERNKKRIEAHEGLTHEARLKAAKEYEELNDQIFDKDVELAEKQRDLTLSQIEIRRKTGEDSRAIDREEAEANLKILDIEGKRIAATTRIRRMKGSLMRSQAAAAKTAADQAQKALEKYENGIISLQHRVEQAKIKLALDESEDSFAKVWLQADFDLIEIDKLEQKFKEQNKMFLDEFGELPKEAQLIFDDLRAVIIDALDFDLNQLTLDLIEQFGSQSDLRRLIDEEYKKIIETMERDMEINTTSAFTAEHIEEVKKQWTKALVEFDNEHQEKDKAAYRIFSIMVGKSRDDLLALKKDARDVLEFLKEGEWDEEKGALFGLTKEQFDDILSDPKQFAEFEHVLKKINDALFRLKNPLKQIKEGFDDLTGSVKLTKEEQLKAIQKMIDGWGALSNALKVVSGALTGLAELTGSGILGDISQGFSDIMDVTDAMADGAAAGAMFGPAGAIAGAALGAISSITGKLSENKKHRDELRKQVEENERKEYFGQLEIEQIWRQKYKWAQKIGEATLHYMKRESEELEKQAKANQSAQDKLWDNLMKQQYKSGEHFKRTGLFGWGKGKIVEEWESLFGKSFEEIEEMAQKGLLSEEATEVYNAYKAAREEGEELSDMMEENMEKWRELYTGTSFDGLVDGIVNAFKQGKRSAADFADSFEELMQGAIVSAIQLMADEQLREWYVDFAEKGKDGYSQEDIEEARRDYIRIMENLNAQAEALEEATGIFINDIGKQSAATIGAYEKVTQDQWNRTDGLLRGMHQMAVIDSDNIKSIANWTEDINDMRNIAMSSWNELVAINRNTKLIENTNAILDKIKRDGIKII